jgi:lambda family phage portal protein
VANPIDKLVGWISPRAGLNRHLDRLRLTRAYEAASPRDTWRPRRAGASANADHFADASALRSKARALVQNVPYIRAAIDALVAATVGTGIIVRGTGPQAAAVNKLLAAWTQTCDADGRLDYNGLVAAADRAMEQDGEVLVRLRPRRPADNLPVPLQLQLLEIDWLDSTRTQTYGTNQIINGIEYDAIGQVAAYWLWNSHPGDITIQRGANVQSRRIEAASIIHLYASERPGQGRGFSRLASVIARVRDLQLYEDAELARKNLETRLSVLYSGDASQLENPNLDGTAASPGAAVTGNLGDLASGSITQLPAGGNVTVVAPSVAEGYVDYVKHQLHLIAAGIGVTYEQMTGDMREVNYSSARVRLLDFRRAVQQIQWLTLKPRLLDPIHRAFINAAVDGGMLPSADYAVDYSFPKWDYVNPEQDVRADLAEISGGLSSISEKLRQRGYQPEDVFTELAADIARMKELGILDVLLLKEVGKSPVTEQAQAAGAKQGRRLDDIEGLLERMGAQLDTLMSRSPTINVQTGETNVSVPERSVTVEGSQTTVTVEPAPVNNEVRVDGAVVNVPAAEAPVVHVSVEPAAAEVRVVNEVNPTPVNVSVPARTSVSEVEYDARGRIARTTRREQ